MDVEFEIEILEIHFELALYQTEFLPDGTLVEVRRLVDKVDKFKLEIFPNEHPPPHFHVIHNNVNCSISIMDGKLIEGSLDSKTLKRIEHFRTNNLQKLIKVWNFLRPTDCSVGPINPNSYGS